MGEWEGKDKGWEREKTRDEKARRERDGRWERDRGAGEIEDLEKLIQLAELRVWREEGGEKKRGRKEGKRGQESGTRLEIR